MLDEIPASEYLQVEYLLSVVQDPRLVDHLNKPSSVKSGKNMVYRDLHGNFSGEFYTTNSRGVNSSHIEDNTSGGMHNSYSEGYLHECMRDRQLTKSTVENSPSRKLPRSASDGEVALFRPDFIPLTKTSVEPRANSRSRRRRSIREPKASGSSSASQISTSKRYVRSLSCFEDFITMSLKSKLTQTCR